MSFVCRNCNALSDIKLYVVPFQACVDAALNLCIWCSLWQFRLLDLPFFVAEFGESCAETVQTQTCQPARSCPQILRVLSLLFLLLWAREVKQWRCSKTTAKTIGPPSTPAILQRPVACPAQCWLLFSGASFSTKTPKMTSEPRKTR